jgi:hypothetical protein
MTRIAFQVWNVFSYGMSVASNARNMSTQDSKRSELPLTGSKHGASLLWL